MLYQLKNITLLLMLGGALSCHSPFDLDPPGSHHIRGPKVRIPQYGWGFANRSDHDINFVYITWKSGIDTFSAGAGILPAGPVGEKDDDEGWDPIPDFVTMTWKESNTRRSEVIEVAPKIPNLDHFSGTIVIIYDGKHWHLTLKLAAR